MIAAAAVGSVVASAAAIAGDEAAFEEASSPTMARQRRCWVRSLSPDLPHLIID